MEKKQELLIKIPFDLTLLPPNTFLVGGVVRDAILQRKRFPLDLDFVLPENTIQTARNISKKYKGGFVVLDSEREIARVVLKDITLDFAQQEGITLEDDLKRRDFTINAIAYNPKTETIFDPLKGIQDLEKMTLKMVSETNLKDDPLRLLRAYRQAAQLNFSIEKNTLETIKNLAPLLTKVAAERIRTELDYLLQNGTLGNHYLNLIFEHKLITPWLKNTEPKQLQMLDKIDLFTEKLAKKYPEYKINKNWNYLAKITCLVSPQPEIAEQELLDLKYSRFVIRHVITTLKNLTRLINSPKINLKEQYFLFLDTKDVFPVLGLLSCVNIGNIETFNHLLHRYFNADDGVAHPKPLVTGNDLQRELALKPSPEIGKLLTEITIAHIEGKINTVSEAIALAKNIIKLGNNY